MPKKKTVKKKVETLVHEDAKRRNIPTAEYDSLVDKNDKASVSVAYERRNRDLDPQLVWRGKDEQDWSDLVVNAPPLYIQEKVHPKVLVEDLMKKTEAGEALDDEQMNMFADFNGVPDEADKTDFYEHDQNWTNRMILGDSLQVMASLAEREGLRGKVQCIYFDPPYGINFSSNWQWSTESRDVKDGKKEHISREPEMVKAFRDTWSDGIHSYLTYLRDRLTVARDLLSETGAIYVQIGDENVHRVRALMDEVFGEKNFISMIAFKTSVPLGASYIPGILNYILLFAKDRRKFKYRRVFEMKEAGAGAYTSLQLPDGSIRTMTSDERSGKAPFPKNARYLFNLSLLSAGRTESCVFEANVDGRKFNPGGGKSWKTNQIGMERLRKAGRLYPTKTTIRYILYYDDYPVKELTDSWNETSAATDKIYVVQTNIEIVKRCLLMASDPGDLVLDPTCGSGTTAYVAEQWGRRWITIDTSRVSLALARSRIMGARYPMYILADSKEGQAKEAEISRTVPTESATYGNIKHGFIYERVPHITLGSISNNAEIDVIWDEFQSKLELLREELNAALNESWEEWQIPHDLDTDWSSEVKALHAKWWDHRIARQKEIDASIAAKGDYEFLYDKPYEDKKKVRVAGPFTVESLSPHRVLSLDENDELIDGVTEDAGEYNEEQNFTRMILDNLKVAGVQQAHKEDKINFSSIALFPGSYICAEGFYTEGDVDEGVEKRAAIFIGPEFGTVSRPDLVEAAREAGDAGFDVLIACAFNYDAHSTEFDKLGRIPVLKARMNADLHMAEDLKKTSAANLFVIFGEPDIDVIEAEDGLIQVKINGVDVFKPQTGKVISSSSDEIACWFIDTDYNSESFFVRHAYFLGANDPYKALRTTLKAEINAEAWDTLNSDTSRPFRKPAGGRIAVKVINHLGDEVMKIFKV